MKSSAILAATLRAATRPGCGRSPSFHARLEADLGELPSCPSRSRRRRSPPGWLRGPRGSPGRAIGRLRQIRCRRPCPAGLALAGIDDVAGDGGDRLHVPTPPRAVRLLQPPPDDREDLGTPPGRPGDARARPSGPLWDPLGSPLGPNEYRDEIRHGGGYPRGRRGSLLPISAFRNPRLPKRSPDHGEVHPSGGFNMKIRGLSGA